MPGTPAGVQDAVQRAEAFPGDVDRTADVAWLGDVTRDDLHFGAERDEVTDPADPVTDTLRRLGRYPRRWRPTARPAAGRCAP